MSDSLERLHRSVLALQTGDPVQSRTARLIRAGRSKVAKKLAEEAVEVVIDAMRGDREAVVRESADLLYNLVVLWTDMGIAPQDVWAEMERREKLLGLAEKLPKTQPANDTLEEPVRRKVVALGPRSISKRRRSGY
ncbi:phosphoribosyl-ATP diphosphatase [Pseudorhodoplanes sinuspersici]|uniref:Phosphoribosyl-ATP pyrophosphatase n=1 Tax=Pseudorhodoplanes sinuspersici TaxID=1235591 RepID=A0A1W6ZM67_9HYPH|nr:phosphoribosyl-ATP diphosphatase [Pseudorhodoplanes sinuspersici]ARP98461.1 phosphoribosyl-ATP diphosphatase [Pseudorhodoplanes sinuspersici]RKE66134.1 phosphoribosyl-ATP pyrophosphatase [Pseudorhodoplanes sinuspersici]